ncbi:hypothetical protein [Shinella sp.]|uniref:hypothetical protein n=1 Tax=Shinella sp. TaxID=1870904 RepID=UPI003F6F059C
MALANRSILAGFVSRSGHQDRFEVRPFWLVGAVATRPDRQSDSDMDFRIQAVACRTAMTAVTDFISELILAANEANALPVSETRRLIERAITTIRDLREVVGLPLIGTDADKLIDLGQLSATAEARSGADISTALLSAAAMIRDLRIVLDSEVEIMMRVLDDQHDI